MFRLATAWLAAGLFVAAGSLSGAEPDEQLELHRRRMKEIASSITIYESAEASSTLQRTLRSEPVLRYADPTRESSDSALWIWGDRRPAAIMAIEYYPAPPRGPRWLFEIASLSPNRISAKRETDLDWTAEEPGLNLQLVPEAPTPAEKPSGRLTQMKQIQRRFTASEKTATEGRIELRELARPIHRYSDEKAGVIDGGIVAYSNGTNPEVFLILEAHGKNGVPEHWHYSLAQMTGAEVTVQLDGEDIWSRQEADPPAVRESYVNGWISSEP